MFYFYIEYIFFLIYFILRLYCLIDKKFIFSRNGGKLEKYVLSDNLQNITSNFDLLKKNFFLNYLKLIKPPNIKNIKKFFIINLFSIIIILFKFSLSYNFFISNFIFISFFNIKIDISSLLEDNIIYFKLSYFILFSFYIYDMVIIIYSKNFSKSNKNKEKNKCIFDLPQVSLYTMDQEVNMISCGLYQNIMVTGSIGSGKTSCAISTLMQELLLSSVYGLVIDVKGNYIEIVKDIALNQNISDKVIEISLTSEYGYNPLNANISSFELANRLKQVLMVLSSKNVSDSYWLDKAEGYIRDFITIIKGYSHNITFYELHMLVTSKEYLYNKLEILKRNILDNKYSENELFEINSAILNIKNEFLKLDDRTIGIIKSEITRITSVFVSDKNIFNKFCNTKNNVCFNEDNIYVLSLNIGKNRQLSKIISTYLKLDFQSQILSRKVNSNPVFFICDEYQEIVNEQDAAFFSLSREYKCINIVSMQSYTSLINALSNENTAQVIIQNFVNKIWFRNDDSYTISQIIKQLGKEVKKYETLNYSESSQDSKYNFLLRGFKNYKSGLSKSISISDKIDYMITEDFFSKELKTFEASILISNGTDIKFIKKVKLKRWDEYKK